MMIDINNLLFRGLSVLPDLNYKNKNTGGLFSFVMQLCKNIREHDPDYIVGCVDLPPYKRKEIFPEYKEFRKPKKDFEEYEKRRKLLNENRKYCIDFLNQLSIPIIQEEGYEADDIMGYVVKKFEHIKTINKIILLSGDDDLYQLLNKKTSIQLKSKVYTYEMFKEDYNIEPRFWALVNAIAGGHNGWKGVKGAGPVTALQSLDNPKFLMEHRETIDTGLLLTTLPFKGLYLDFKITEPEFQYINMIKFLASFDIKLVSSIHEALSRYEV